MEHDQVSERTFMSLVARGTGGRGTPSLSPGRAIPLIRAEGGLARDQLAERTFSQLVMAHDQVSERTFMSLVAEAIRGGGSDRGASMPSIRAAGICCQDPGADIASWTWSWKSSCGGNVGAASS